MNGLRSVINATNNGTYDAFIFYFAGHGIQYKDKNSDEKDGKDESILAADGHPILDDELFLLISRLNRGKEASFVFDCCHSGSMLDLPKVAMGGGSSHGGRMGVPGKVACFSACSESGKSIEKQGHGLFTSSLCKLLRKKGLNSKITPILLSVKDYLESQHSNMTLTVSCSNQIAIRKSTLIDLKTVGHRANRANRGNGDNQTKSRSINLEHHPGFRKARGANNKKENCYISPFNKPKNPTMNVSTCRNTYLKNCRTATMSPWKPKALRHLKNRPCV